MIAFEQTVVDSTFETENANAVIESQFTSKPEDDNPAPQEPDALAPEEREKAIPSLAMKTVEPEIAPSIDKPIKTQAADELEPAELFLLEQAREALAENNYVRALELLENELTEKKEIRELYVQALRGQAGLLLDKNTAKAEKLLVKAVEIDIKNAMAYYDLGKLHTHTKDHSKAIEAYLIAIDLDPASADTFFNLGFNYAAIKNYAHAEKMFLRTTELKPAYLDEAIFNLAMVQYKQGKKQQCIENLEKAVKENPGNQRAHKYLKRFRNTDKHKGLVYNRTQRTR